VHIHKADTKFPWLLFLSLCIHSFLEGFPIHEHNDMVYGVLIHKIDKNFGRASENHFQKNGFYTIPK